MQKLLLQWPELLTSKRNSFLLGHGTTVHSVAITPDGQRAVSGDTYAKILVWNLTEQHCLGALVGHTDMVRAVAISPDGKRAASCGVDNTVFIWDLQTLEREQVLTGSTSWVVALAFAPDGRKLLSGGYCDEAPIRLWDLSDGTCGLLKLPITPQAALSQRQQMQRVCAVSITPDGRHAVSVGDSIVLWDLESCQPLRVLLSTTFRTWCIAIAPSGRLAVTGGVDAIVRVWDLQAGNCIAELRGHKDQVQAVAISSDGRFALSGGKEAVIYVWDLQLLTAVNVLKYHSKQVLCLALSPNNRLLVSGGADQVLRLTKDPWVKAAGT